VREGLTMKRFIWRLRFTLAGMREIPSMARDWWAMSSESYWAMEDVHPVDAFCEEISALCS